MSIIIIIIVCCCNLTGSLESDTPEDPMWPMILLIQFVVQTDFVNGLNGSLKDPTVKRLVHESDI